MIYLYYFMVESHMRKRLQDNPALTGFSYGWGNGYILIPPKHPFYGVDWDEQPPYAHGGITYAAEYKGFNIIERTINKGYDYQLSEELSKRIEKDGHDFLQDYWCVGFDTAHHGDDLETCSKEYVWNETQNLCEQALDEHNKDILAWKTIFLRKYKLKNLERL